MPRILTALFLLLPALAWSQTVGGPVVGTSLVVNNNPGNQTEPHVSGTRVVYTNQLSRTTNEVRYHDLNTGADQGIDTGGFSDSSPDVQADRAVFTRLSDTNHIFFLDLTKGGAAQELAPRPDVDRRTAAIGGQLVTWQEQGYTARGVSPEIFAYRLDTQTLTQLTQDKSTDQTPAVSNDGQVVVWTKCASGTTGCDIWSAQATSGGYELKQLTGAEGEESQPDTNGSVVVYVTQHPLADGTTEQDIAWQPVGGGEAHILSLPGPDTHPNISGPLIAFEHWNASASTPNYDVVLYDLRTQTYYQLTDTTGSESLSDISMTPDGFTRVVWSVRQNGELNVNAFVFRLPIDCPTQPPPDAAAVCASPGSRPLLGTLQVVRGQGDPADENFFTSIPKTKGTGVLCVDNGQGGSRTTDGWVWLGAGVSVAPGDFGADVASISTTVALQNQSTLSAEVDDDDPTAAFHVRLYGETTCSATPSTTPSALPASSPPQGPPEVREGRLLRPVSLGVQTGTGGLAHGFAPEGQQGHVPHP